MEIKMKNAFALLCVAALLFANGDAQEEQDCVKGPAPPSDLEIFLWLNSGLNRRLSGKEEAALERLRCPKVYVNSTVDGWTPLHWMSNISGNSRSSTGFETAVEALIENGADLEARDAQGFTPLHLASEMNSRDVLEALRSTGVNLEAKDNFGNTPLAVASYFGKDFAIRWLLESGANPNVRYIEAPGSTNPGGGNFKTPLHFVALYGLGPLEELIEAGADVNAVDSDGNTPLDFAIEFKRVRTISVLEEARRQAEQKSSAQGPGL